MEEWWLIVFNTKLHFNFLGCCSTFKGALRFPFALFLV